MTTIVLGIDTATMTQTIALVKRDLVGQAPQALWLAQRQERQNHGVTLIEHIEQGLHDQDLTLKDLSLISVGLGPGSFTGLRVGLAVAKGLSRVSGAPIVGVSTLATMAYAMHSKGPTWAAIDARRREVYAGLYQRDERGQLITLERERAYAPDELLEVFKRSVEERGPGLSLAAHKISGYKPLANLSELGIRISLAPLDQPNALATAALGLKRFIARGLRGDDLISLEPDYIRPSDAEISLMKRQQQADASEHA